MTTLDDRPPDYAYDDGPPADDLIDDHDAFLDGLQLFEQRAPTIEPDKPIELNLRVPALHTILNGDQPDETPIWLSPPDGPALFYPGRYHDLHGQPSGGKTWIALAVCAEILTRGDGGILWIDWEDTPATFVRRLQALGVPDVLIGDPTLVRYVQPQGPLHREELVALLEHARAVDAALLVLDALAPALALDGLDENSNTDVTRWVERTVKPFLADGRAVIGLDHIPKDPDNRSIGGRGAGAKRAIIDGASYTVLTVTPFSRKRRGEVKLRIAKDRPGMVGPVGTIAAHIELIPHDAGGRLETIVKPPPETTDKTTGDFRPTHLMERVSRWFEARPAGELASQNDIEKGVKGKGQHLRAAVRALSREGHLTVDSTGTNDAYALAQPYREPDRVPASPGASPPSQDGGANADEGVRVPASPGYYKPGTRDAPQPHADDEGRVPDPTLDHEEPW
jgi:hypothetical protein